MLQIAKFDDPSYQNQNIGMYHRCVWVWEVQEFRQRTQKNFGFGIGYKASCLIGIKFRRDVE